VASRAGRSKGTKEVLTLKGEIKDVIVSVKDGSLERNDAAVMIQGYRALKDFIEVERRIREQEELEGRLAELERALEAMEVARGA